MSLTILNPTEVIENPTVIIRTSEIGENWMGESSVVSGSFARVNIRTAEDWMLIKMMRHGVDYFPPCSGSGLLVKAELLRKP